MDGNQFDRLARVIGAATSRRGMLKTLAGGAFGVLAAGAGQGTAAAKSNARCRLLDAPCVQNQDCCSKHCCDGACCAPVSACPPGWQHCGKSPCVDPQTDIGNCGVCRHACPSGQTCAGGACGCPDGTVPCGGGCLDTRDLDGDPYNCGACGYVCPHGQFCSGGLCGTCRQMGDGCDTDGDCCGGYCNQGGCDLCPEGTARCDGACVNLATDSYNCGACGHGCAFVEVCNGAGVCIPCPLNEGNCNGVGVCVNLTSDPANCGGCGIACGEGQTCLDRVCTGPCQGPPCPEGQTRLHGCRCACACTSMSCACAAGSGCAGDATICAYTTAGVCCPWPQRSFACQDSALGAGDGFALCCTQEAGDCPPCPSGIYAIGGRTNNCDPPPNRGGSAFGPCYPEGSGRYVEGGDSMCS